MRYRLFLATLVIAASSTAFAGDELDITDATCSIEYINEVAQKEGLEKAQTLASNCIANGYEDLKEDVKEAGDSLLNHYENAKEFVSDKTNEYSEKAENIKKELMR